MNDIFNIGSHRVSLASVDCGVVENMLGNDRVSILHSDPPWGDGNLKYWVTLNKRMTGNVFTSLTYDALIARLFGLVHRYVDGFVFIETGLRWETLLAKRFETEGLKNIRIVRMRYKSGSRWLEQTLVGGTTGPQYSYDYQYADLEPVDEIVTIIRSTKVPAGSIVLDPCCGMGNLARAAVKTGMRFRGNEFNAARLQKTIDFLKKSVG